MEKTGKIVKQTRKLLAGEGLGVLATMGESSLRQGLVAFAATEDLLHVVFATPKYTRKYENILNTPEVSLLIDDRSNTSVDFLECTALSVQGKAEPVPEDEEEAFRKLYLERHPYLEEFLRAPSSALVRIRVELYSVVSNFQRVREWSPAE